MDISQPLSLDETSLKRERERENSLQMEAIFSCLLLSDVCKMPPSQPGSSLTRLLSFSSGSVANTPGIHEHRISWKSKKTGNGRIYKEALCPLTLKCCSFVFMWPHYICVFAYACVCETRTGVKPRLQIENVLNTHPDTFTLNQCQTTCAQHVNKLSDLFESPA